MYELQKRAGLIKGEKTTESSRALEARVAVLEAKSENSSNESLFADVKPTACNRDNPALDRKVNGTRQSHTDASCLGPSKGDSQWSVLKDSYIQPLSNI